MEMYYGSKGVNNYIEVCIKESDFEKSGQLYIIRMLEDNDIKGIIRPAVSKLDDKIFLRYPVNSLFVLDKYFLKSKPDIKVLEKALKCICDCIKNAESFLLNVNDLVVSPGFMLWNDRYKKIEMIYSPFYARDIRVQLKEFMEYIMQIFNYKSTQGTMKMHSIYEIVSEEGFDIDDVIKLCDEKDSSDIKPDFVRASSFTDSDSVKYDKNNNSKNEAVILKENNNSENEAVILKENNNYEIVIGINAAISSILFLAFLFIKKEKLLLLSFIISIIVLVINSIVYILKKDKEDEIDIDESMKEFGMNYFSSIHDFKNQKPLDNYANRRSNEDNKNRRINEDNKNRKTDEDYEIDESIHTIIEKEDTKNKKVCVDSMKEKRQYKLVPLNDGMLEPIVLDSSKHEITIGRGHSEVDYRLNKEQISRVHACIIFNNEGLYIEDKNSTNGTYINSIKLQAYTRTGLSVGDTVKLANEEFFVL